MRPNENERIQRLRQKIADGWDIPVQRLTTDFKDCESRKFFLALKQLSELRRSYEDALRLVKTERDRRRQSKAPGKGHSNKNPFEPDDVNRAIQKLTGAAGPTASSPAQATPASVSNGDVDFDTMEEFAGGRTRRPPKRRRGMPAETGQLDNVGAPTPSARDSNSLTQFPDDSSPRHNARRSILSNRFQDDASHENCVFELLHHFAPRETKVMGLELTTLSAEELTRLWQNDEHSAEEDKQRVLLVLRLPDRQTVLLHLGLQDRCATFYTNTELIIGSDVAEAAAGHLGQDWNVEGWKYLLKYEPTVPCCFFLADALSLADMRTGGTR